MISTNHYISMVVFVISNQKMTFICLPKQDSISYQDIMAHSFWTKMAYSGYSVQAALDIPITATA